jgi:hypothetical protein
MCTEKGSAGAGTYRKLYSCPLVEMEFIEIIVLGIQCLDTEWLSGFYVKVVKRILNNETANTSSFTGADGGRWVTIM